jgi:DNA mismatch repair protein MutL
LRGGLWRIPAKWGKIAYPDEEKYLGKIKVLPPHIADMLRAGEVVERPASALKELIENSLDAGAAHIKIEIKQGGKKLILVADDGEGMEKEDALLALERHATSKLHEPEKGIRIETLGFRGEALPSIASVAKLTLTTAPRGQKEGVEIECAGGSIASRRPSPARGTIVEVKDIFFNTPARKKFLKSDSTEGLHAVGVVTSHALSHPGTGFILKTDGMEAVNLSPAGDEKERIAGLYGADFLEGLKEISSEGRGIKLYGLVSSGGNFRSTKSHQFIFLNRRPVRDGSVSHAVYSALAVPSGRHPIFFLYLTIDPALFDVNAHPRKEEVRWREKDLIYRAVYGAVRGIAPEENIEGNKASSAFGAKSAAPILLNPGGEYRVYEDITPLLKANAVSESLPLEYSRLPAPAFLKLGEMFYAVPEGGGITIIDHHAAHERVLYEKLLHGVRMRAKGLLFPRQVKLPPREYRALLEKVGVLGELGLHVEDFGKESVLIRALPRELENGDLQGMLLDLASAIIENGGTGMEELKKEAAARLACHSSVRGSDAISGEELSSLLGELALCRDPGHCPHGRPTKIKLTLNELKKMFRRK